METRALLSQFQWPLVIFLHGAELGVWVCVLSGTGMTGENVLASGDVPSPVLCHQICPCSLMPGQRPPRAVVSRPDLELTG